MDKSMDYSVNDVEADERTVLGEKTGTVADRDAMARLGKDQLFKVSQLPSKCTPEPRLT